MEQTTENRIDYPVVRNVYADKLKEGDIYKNYKELCTYLEEEVKTGDSRNAQHKEWRRYFDYEKEGQKYIITEIYSEPLPKDDKRTMGNNSEYLPHIELILLDYLSKQSGKTASLTVNKLFLLLGMCNTNYTNKYYTVDDGLIDSWNINHFNQRSYKKLSRILFDALNNLQNRRLIDYQQIKIINVDEKHNLKIINVTRPATPIECDWIRMIERETLLQMGFRSLVLVHLKFKTKEFYEIVTEKLEKRYGIHFYYTQIEMRFTHKHIVQAKTDMETIMTLNNKIMDGLNKEAETKLQNNIKKYDELVEQAMNSDTMIGKPNIQGISSNYFHYNKDGDDVYLYAQRKLAELFIKIEQT